MFSVTKES